MMSAWASSLHEGLRVAAVAVALAGAAAALAGQRLDDTTSPRAQVQPLRVLSEQGRPLAETLNPRFAILEFGRIDYRLATAAYLGRPARIYFVLPDAVPGLRSPAGLRIQWRGLGGFASGMGRPGERVLVWSGVVREPWLQESIELTWQLDLTQVDLRHGQFGLQAYFEIETVN
jgi:hypothetical protein